VRVNHALPELTQRFGRSPTIPELASHLDVSTDDIAEAMDAVQAYSTSSLDAPVGEDGPAPIESVGDADPSIELLEDRSSIAPAVAELSSRDRRVLYLRFFRGMTQSEIADDVGVSQMHVSRILSGTLGPWEAPSGSLRLTPRRRRSRAEDHSANCASSVEPLRASVDASPPVITSETRSK
jgi:RNA polymerase sigma-B factor